MCGEATLMSDLLTRAFWRDRKRKRSTDCACAQRWAARPINKLDLMLFRGQWVGRGGRKKWGRST